MNVISKLSIAAIAAVAVGAPLCLHAPAHAQRTPLIMEGKTTLYQRVLSRPGTPLVEDPGAEADANAEPLPPLTPLYVFNRVEMNGRTWLEVGRANQSPTDGWVNADRTIPWRQAMTLSFTNPAGREPTLFFRGYDPLVEVVEGPSPGSDAAGLRSTVASGEVPSDFPVVSVEPDTHIDLSENFYLLPILDHDEAYFEDGFISRVVKVAAVTADPDAEAPAPPAPPQPQPVGDVADATDELPPEPELAPVEVVVPDVDPANVLSGVHSDFRAGVVFVIDTTTSMDPYIEEVRTALGLMYDQLARSEYGDRVDFGLIGYRDNTEAAPGLGYLTNLYADLGEARDRAGFLTRVNEAQAATASSRGFDEDPIAGIFAGLNEISWAGYDSRWIVLITDAGARSGSDPLSATGLGPQEIASLAREQGVALSTLHLQTPSGANNHDTAELQYQLLTRLPGSNETLYQPIQAGSVSQFQVFVETAAQAIAFQIEQAGDGQLIDLRDEALAEARRAVQERREALRLQREQEARERAQAAAEAQARAQTDRERAEAAAAQAAAEAELAYQEQLADYQRQLALAGRAMQLAYLGREAGTQAPTFFEAWASDRDLDNPALATFEVRVLLSRNQLSDLTLALRTILDTAERTRMSPRDFFNQLQTASALLSRTPENVGSVNRLAQVGVVGEYLEGLPYRSRILEINEDTWLSWSFDQQREFLDELRQKIQLYERLSDEVTLWEPLDGGRNPGDAVFPVPLSALP